MLAPVLSIATVHGTEDPHLYQVSHSPKKTIGGADSLTQKAGIASFFLSVREGR